MLDKIYREEDLFPGQIAECVERDYGFLFFDENNKNSYDSNHAVIFREQLSNPEHVVSDIIKFYQDKEIRPLIYQSIRDSGYFKEISAVLIEAGFKLWTEQQNFMVLCEQNKLVPNADIAVCKVTQWMDEYGTEIFERSGEPWGIDPLKKALKNENTHFFIAHYREKPVGMIYCHVTDGICRVDYLLVSKEHRGKGIGRALVNAFVLWVKEIDCEACYLWPDGDTAERIYYEAGFRSVQIKQAARAAYRI